MLPSLMAPYEVKEIEIEPFKPMVLNLISRAHASGTVDPLLKALQGCVNIDTNLLTPGDFFFLLTWQRIHSRAIPVEASWSCLGTVYELPTGQRINDTQLIQYYRAYQENPEGKPNPNDVPTAVVSCGHVQKRALTWDDFRVIEMNQDPLDPDLTYPRMGLWDQYLKMADDVELSAVARQAMWVKDGFTLADKVAIIRNQETMDLFDRACLAEVKYNHGIAQAVALPCEKCGYIHLLNYNVSAKDFL